MFILTSVSNFSRYFFLTNLLFLNLLKCKLIVNKTSCYKFRVIEYMYSLNSKHFDNQASAIIRMTRIHSEVQRSLPQLSLFCLGFCYTRIVSTRKLICKILQGPFKPLCTLYYATLVKCMSLKKHQRCFCFLRPAYTRNIITLAFSARPWKSH